MDLMETIILASASPRRRELLEMAGIPFVIQAADVDESLPQGILPEEAVQLLAQKKARAVDTPNRVVLAADTVVALDGVIFGKPQNEEDARQMLRALSGKTHQVHTGVCLHKDGKEIVFCETAKVEFYPLTEEEINRYVSSKEPLDKAGAYGIQGKSAVFVEKIDGDYSNVVGLPLARLYQELKQMGIDIKEWHS